MQQSETERFLQQQEGWFSCGEHRMRYLHVPCNAPNAASRPAVVFVHGLLGYSFSWRHNLEHFAQYRDVYAVDLLGIGHSDRPPTGAVDLGLAATGARLVKFMRLLGHRQIDLVGTSHGGAVSMFATSQDRSSGRPLIRRLVLVAPAHPFMPNARLRLALFSTAIGRFIMRNIGPRMLPAHGLGNMYWNTSLITPETRAGYNLNLANTSSYDYALEIVRTWRNDMEQLRKVLSTISDIPTFLLWGREDAAVSAESGLLLQQFFRNAKYEVLPHVGHLPYEEAPEEFNTRVLRYLES